MKTKWVRQILVPFVLIALIASTALTYISIKSKYTVQPVKEVSLEIIPDYKITSRKGLMIWPEGTVFEQGMAAYFYAAMPEINITPTIRISELARGSVNGTIKSQIVIQAVNDKFQVYWSYRLQETQVQTFTLSQDKPAFTAPDILVDVSAASSLAARISNELMFQNALLQLAAVSDINVSGTVNGIPIEKSIVHTLPITLQQVSFSIPKSNDAVSQISLYGNNVNQGQQPSLTDILRDNLMPISINLALLVLLLVLLATGNMNKSKAAVEHRRFKEWITEGSVEIKDRLKINILTLEGLVDLAIDLDRRVIFDPRINKYYVLTEDIAYTYDSEHSRAILDNRQQLGKLLLERGLLKPEQLEIGLYYQKNIGTRLGESLIALGFIDETTLYSTLAGQQGIDYYELDTRKEITESGWLDKMNIPKARALMALPLGEREDGKLVVASSEASREGIKKALEEIFGTDIKMVATRPSAIYEVLERLEAGERQKTNCLSQGKEDKITSFERLTEKEREEFTTSYYRGSILHDLLLKASGLADPVVLTQVPEQESALGWLASRNIISGEIVNLIKGLDKACEAMDWKARQEKRLPGLLDLLLKANYITSETVEWVDRELALQGLEIGQLLCRNYLASEDTLNNAALLLGTLESILNNH